MYKRSMKLELKKLLSAAKLVNSFGGRIVFIFPDGLMHVTAEEFVDVVPDPDKWLAKKCGATWEQYMAWKKHEIRCQATNKNGKQCNNWVEQHCGGPETFIIGTSDRCRLHKKRP